MTYLNKLASFGHGKPSYRALLLGLVSALWCGAALAGNPPGIPVGGTADSLTVKAQGSLMERLLSARLAERFNVRDYGAVGDGTTDDSAAFAATITAMNAAAPSGPACLYVPPGVYYINSVALPAFAQNFAGCILGDGHWQSIIKLGTGYSGDLFAWSDAWFAGVFNTGGTSITYPQKVGPRVIGIGIQADTTATAQQNAFMFYDHNDGILMRDVEVDNLHGRVIYAGATKFDTSAYTRESRFEDIATSSSGMAGVPVVEFTSQCTVSCTGGDASNEIEINRLKIYAPNAQGLVIRNANPATGGQLRQFRLAQLRVEGLENAGTTITGDLVQIGDATATGLVRTITCTDCELVSPYSGYFDLHVLAPTTAGVTGGPKNITFSGALIAGAGLGGGIKIDSGSSLFFKLNQIGSVAKNVTVASSATVGGPIVVDEGGYENYITTTIDSTSLPFLYYPVLKGTSGALSLQVPDSTVNGGNVRGAYSVDFSQFRTAANQVASGPYSFNCPGSSIAATASYSFACGNTGTSTGTYSFGFGLNVYSGGFASRGHGQNINLTGAFADGEGYGVSDGGRWGLQALAGGYFVTAGDAQYSKSLLRGTGTLSTSATVTVRVTADGATAAAANLNNIGVGKHYHMQVSGACIDYTSTANITADWDPAGASMTRKASLTYAGAFSTAAAPTRSEGVFSGATMQVSADGTNYGLSANFVLPAATAADTVHCMATVMNLQEMQ